MSTTRILFSIVVSVGFVVLNTFYWWFGMGRWQDAFRRRCERRYRVTIQIQGKGYWDVVEDIPWYRSFGIEMLQLAYLMAVFFGWAMWLGLGAFLLWILGQLGLSPWVR
jgi:hypothetical protein